MLRFVLHVAIALAATGGVVWVAHADLDSGLALLAGFLAGWVFSKAHGCCTLCRHTAPK